MHPRNGAGDVPQRHREGIRIKQRVLHLHPAPLTTSRYLPALATDGRPTAKTATLRQQRMMHLYSMLPVMARAVANSLRGPSRITFTVEGVTIAVLSTLPIQHHDSCAAQSRSIHRPSLEQEALEHEASSSCLGHEKLQFDSHAGNREAGSHLVRYPWLVCNTVPDCWTHRHPCHNSPSFLANTVFVVTEKALPSFSSGGAHRGAQGYGFVGNKRARDAHHLIQKSKGSSSAPGSCQPRVHPCGWRCTKLCRQQSSRSPLTAW
jgi:hypothetical protein